MEYVNRESSEVIKGILICLIVLGHNHILCPNTVSGGMMDFLYQFHVGGFFVLPFFYQRNISVSWETICNIIIRCWIPYLWVCILCWLTFSLYQHTFDFGWRHVMAFFNGTPTPVLHYFGFIFPWFLPTYCSLSILLLLAWNNKWLYYLFIILGLGTFLMSWQEFYDLKLILPFGVGPAIHYFVSGVIAFVVNKHIKYGKYIGASLFAILSFFWWMNFQIGLLYHLMPTAFFLLLLCVVPYMCFNWLRLLGKYSLGIYLFHVFVLNIMFRLFPQTVLWGWIELFLSVSVSLLITIGINKVGRIRKLLFPHTLMDFKR